MNLFAMPCSGRDGSAAVRRLLSFAVAQTYGTAMPEIVKTEYGKPFFPDRQDIFFSLSHTPGYVVCVLSPYPVGVDIEKRRGVLPGLPRRVCSPEELKQFDFFELWVLKESMIKLSGRLGCELRELIFSREKGGIVAQNTSVRARLYDDIPGCCMAVCTELGELPETVEMVGAI